MSFERLDPYDPDYIPPTFQWVDNWKAEFEQYRRGARVHYEAAQNKEPGGGKREKIMDQSDSSRKRAAFDLGNAECTWHAMVTLTWRNIPEPEDVKYALETLRRKWKVRWGEGLDAWIMEMQQRGAPHYHIFIAAESIVGQTIQQFGHVEKMERTKVREIEGERVEVTKECRIVRGSFETWLVDTWLDCIFDRSPDTLAFQWGGIVELMDSPDAAGRYIAKEVHKREQKELPEHYREGLGRWWYLARRWKPQPRGHGRLELDKWPFNLPLAQVWDGNELTPAVVEYEALGQLSPDAKRELIGEVARRKVLRDHGSDIDPRPNQ